MPQSGPSAALVGQVERLKKLKSSAEADMVKKQQEKENAPWRDAGWCGAVGLVGATVFYDFLIFLGGSNAVA